MFWNPKILIIFLWKINNSLIAPYYVCSRKNCKYNSATIKIHGAFKDRIGQLRLTDGEIEALKFQLVKTFKAMNEDNRQAATTISTNLTKKEKEIADVEMNYALATDPKKQAIFEKVLDKLQVEKVEIEGELENAKKEILNLEKFVDYSLDLRSNLFNMWDVVGLGDKRRLQNLIFPEGIVYNKKTGDIEPLEVNKFFVTTTCDLDDCEKKQSGQTDFYTNLSATAPLQGLEPWTP